MYVAAERYKARAFEPRNLILFSLIALGLIWLAVTLNNSGLLSEASGQSVPSLLLATLGGWSPTIAAIVVTGVTEGRAGLRALWVRFWRGGLSLKWVIISLTFIPAVWLVANLVTRLLGGWANPLLDRPGLFLSQLAVGFIACLGEEFGWRGYMLPRFQVRWNALVSSLILGVLWAAWHTRFPTASVVDPLIAGASPTPAFWEWLIWLIACSVFITWVFNNTKGNPLMAVSFHAMMNAGSYFFWCCTASWHWPAVLVAAAVVIVLVFAPEHLVRRRGKGIA